MQISDEMVFMAVLAVTLALPVIFASTKKTMGRLAYGLRTLPLLVFVLGWLIVGSKLSEPALLASLAAAMAALVFVMLWTVHRLQDAGLTRWIAPVIIFIPVGLFFWGFLLVRQGRPQTVKDEPEPYDIFD